MRHNQFIDWRDKAYVIAYAKQLGEGHTVYKLPDRPQYGICKTVSSTGVPSSVIIKPEWVVYQT